MTNYCRYISGISHKTALTNLGSITIPQSALFSFSYRLLLMGSISPPNVFVLSSFLFFFQVVISILAPLNFLRGGKTKRGGVRGGGEGEEGGSGGGRGGEKNSLS